MEGNKKDNAWVEELKKFIKKEVTVTQYTGEGRKVTTQGKLWAINYSFLTVIISTETEKVLIKNYYSITRKRGK